MATGQEKVSFHYNLKEKQGQRCSTYHTIVLISQAKNAQNSPSQASEYMNHEFPDIQTGFRKGTGTRDQIPNIR